MTESPSHEGRSWPYHEKANGDMVPCASNPCRLHSGDIEAESLEEAYRIRDDMRTNAAIASAALRSVQNDNVSAEGRKASLQALKTLKRMVRERHGEPLPMLPVDADGHILNRPPLPVIAIHGGEDGRMPVYEVSSAYAGEYFSMLTDVFHAGGVGGQVSEETPESLSRMRLFVSPDGMAGAALASDDATGEGNPPDYVTAVCKRDQCSWHHTAVSMVRAAAGQGGKRLDCFNTFLPDIYREAGFCVVGRMTFDDQYAPETWDYQEMDKYNHGRPDVVFMAVLSKDIRERYRNYDAAAEEWDPHKWDTNEWDSAVPRFDDYDQAQRHAREKAKSADEWAEDYFSRIQRKKGK